MMERFGFSPVWRRWIMECISTASTSILVNGSPTEEFKLRRGLRQGDPLSPFLFLLAAEGLSILMRRATESGLFTEAKIGRNLVSVSHLQFADDTVLMGEAKSDNTRIMKRILRNLELISGLKVNFEKSGLFGVNIAEETLSDMAAILGCEVGKLPIPYLGIKVGVNQRKGETWSSVIQKIRSRLKRWDDKNISFGGRITLLNSVLSSIPTFYLSFYKIPAKTLSEIVRLQRNFLWGGREGPNKLSWVKWGIICKSKEEGGLGVKDLGLFNKALLGKWAWRFLNERECLWVRVVESRYGREWGRGEEILVEGVRRRWSGWWKDIVRTTFGAEGGWFEARVKRVVGEGDRTLFWEDVWAGEIPLKLKYPRLFQLSESKGERVPAQKRYAWAWSEEPNGVYSTKSAYTTLTNQLDNTLLSVGLEEGFKLIWNKFTPIKVSAHAWRVLWDRLPTKVNLQRRKIIPHNGEIRCRLCNSKDENGDHIFFECDISYKIWMECLGWLRIAAPLHRKPIENLLFFSRCLRGVKGKHFAISLWLCVIWAIWRGRNDLLFNDKEFSILSIVDDIKARLWSWLSAKGMRCSCYSYSEWLLSPRQILN
ncbi:hypothetical protein OROHE_018183 [Orobanche hederae]